jgi:hypothetical protein
MDAISLDGRVSDIRCPVLMLAGEYDLRDPIAETYRLYDDLTAPAEFWVFADQFDKLSLSGGETANLLMQDWLRDRVEGKPQVRAGQTLYLDAGGSGPNSPHASVKTPVVPLTVLGSSRGGGRRPTHSGQRPLRPSGEPHRRAGPGLAGSAGRYSG